ncbi:MAG: anion transporter, partial [Polyangiaceae bacterium]
IAQQLLNAAERLDLHNRWIFSGVVVLLSNVVSNVPAVMVLKSLIPHLPHADSAWLTLAMSSTLAGNLTLPGSLATIIVIERAKGRASISFLDFLKVGVPTGILSLVVGAAWLTLVR